MLLNDDKYGRKNGVSELRKILCDNDFGYIGHNQSTTNENMLIINFKRASERYVHETLTNSSKLESNTLYKLSYSSARYLNDLEIRKFMCHFASFR